jgi:Rieske Fe-S protein
METFSDQPDRRRFLSRVITTIITAIGGVLAVVLGGAIVAPGLATRRENWLTAGSLGELKENEPQPVVIRVARQDGYREVIDRRTVFLVKTGDADVLALDSTCTHLGCRVVWDPDSRKLKCPCHGGVYSPRGAVEAGPPPAPLVKIQTRIDGDNVLVQV